MLVCWTSLWHISLCQIERHESELLNLLSHPLGSVCCRWNNPAVCASHIWPFQRLQRWCDLLFSLFVNSQTITIITLFKNWTEWTDSWARSANSVLRCTESGGEMHTARFLLYDFKLPTKCMHTRTHTHIHTHTYTHTHTRSHRHMHSHYTTYTCTHGGFLLTCKDFWRMTIHSLPALFCCCCWSGD